MRNIIIMSIVGALIVAIAVAFGVQHRTQASVPVGLYEADIDHDGKVSILDLAKAAAFFGQSAPLPTPTMGPFAFDAVSCNNGVITGNLLVPADYRASRIGIAAFDGADTSSVTQAHFINWASSFNSLNYASTFPASNPFSIPVDPPQANPIRTSTSVFVVVQTWDGLFHEYTVAQCAIPPTPTPCPAGSTDIGGATSPPPANGHFCATYTPTAGPTSTPGPGGSDITPPQLVGFDFTPKQVNTTQSTQTIAFTAHITDDLSGVNGLNLSFQAPTTQQHLYVSFYGTPTSGNMLDGTYQSDATLPAFSEQGVWHLSYASLADNLGNYASLTEAQVVALGFPTAFFNGPGTPPTFAPTPSATPSPTSTVTPGGPTNTPVTGGQDVIPPTLVAFDFTPKSVDTTNSSREITLTAHVTDNLSGLNFLFVQFKGPTTNQYLSVWFQAAQRISGSAQDGFYQTVATLPAYSEYGTWSIVSVEMRDDLGNDAFFGSPSEVAALGFPATFTNGP